MVRPNQIIQATEDTFTFLMFARSESQVKRRVLLLNFPGKILPAILRGDDLDRFITEVTLQTEGIVNRYRVTVDLEEIQNG